MGGCGHFAFSNQGLLVVGPTRPGPGENAAENFLELIMGILETFHRVELNQTELKYAREPGDSDIHQINHDDIVHSLGSSRLFRSSDGVVLASSFPVIKSPNLAVVSSE